MNSEQPLETAGAAPAHSYAAAHVEQILAEHGWLTTDRARSDAEAAIQDWLSRAAELLGPHAATLDHLRERLGLIFSYDAAEILGRRETQEVLARGGAREVIREFANRVLDGGEIDSDRFKEIVDEMKSAVPYRSRAMFHPIRLALTGRAGEGELDRVILLIDGAAKLNFAVPVKGTRERILEFCAALD